MVFTSMLKKSGQKTGFLYKKYYFFDIFFFTLNCEYHQPHASVGLLSPTYRIFVNNYNGR